MEKDGLLWDLQDPDVDFYSTPNKTISDPPIMLIKYAFKYYPAI